jgi:hypothetical protein
LIVYPPGSFRTGNIDNDDCHFAFRTSDFDGFLATLTRTVFAKMWGRTIRCGLWSAAMALPVSPSSSSSIPTATSSRSMVRRNAVTPRLEVLSCGHRRARLKQPPAGAKHRPAARVRIVELERLLGNLLAALPPSASTPFRPLVRDAALRSSTQGRSEPPAQEQTCAMPSISALARRSTHQSVYEPMRQCLR